MYSCSCGDGAVFLKGQGEGPSMGGSKGVKGVQGRLGRGGAGGGWRAGGLQV